MKTLVRNVVADMMHGTGISALLRRMKYRSLAILSYHRVLPAAARAEYPFPELVVAPEAFERHVEYCSSHYDCLPLREAVRRAQPNARPRRPLLVITFDDGYADSFEYARPVLEAYDVCATFFVISSLVGSDMSPWYDRLGRALMDLQNATFPAGGISAESDDVASQWFAKHHCGRRKRSVSEIVSLAKRLDAPMRTAVVEQLCRSVDASGQNGQQRDRIMTQDELIQLTADGHEVASHTRSHPILTRLPPETLATELEGSRSELSAIVGEPVTSFSYPNGDHDKHVVSAIGRAGYSYAVTTRHGLNGPLADPLRLHRVFVSQARLSRPGGDCSVNLLELELTGAGETVFLRRHRRSHAP